MAGQVPRDSLQVWNENFLLADDLVRLPCPAISDGNLPDGALPLHAPVAAIPDPFSTCPLKNAANFVII